MNCFGFPMLQHLARWRDPLAGFVAGWLGSWGFPETGWPWITPLSLALIACYGFPRSLRASIWIGWAYGMGFFGGANAWLSSMLIQYGHTPYLAAMACTMGINAGLACFPAAVWGIWRWLYPTPSPWATVLGFPTLWIGMEYIRGTLFWIGIPYLLIGYTWIDTAWAQAWAPVGSVYLVGWVGLVWVCGIMQWVAYLRPTPDLPPALRLRHCLGIGIGIGGIAIATAWLAQVHWTYPVSSQHPHRISLIQPNIPQDEKFSANHAFSILDQYQHDLEQESDADWIIWPETAMPVLPERIPDWIRHFDTTGASLGTGILLGTHREIRLREFANSVRGYGAAQGYYDKHRLVPIGEYPPLSTLWPGLYAWLQQIFQIPWSNLVAGPAQQPPIQGHGLQIQALICFEAIYPEYVAQQSRTADVLVNISNDTWLGPTNGHAQHLQMARMRAVETGRYLVRATNDGISAIVDPQGQIRTQGPAYVPAVVRGIFYAYAGSTPFQQWGIQPWLCLWALIGIGSVRISRNTKQTLQKTHGHGG